MSSRRFDGPPAIVVGIERNGLGVTRALARCGIDCVAIGGPRRGAEWATRSCVVHSVPEWSADGLLETMDVVSKQYGEPLPVILTKDQAVVWLSRFRDDIRNTFLLDIPSQSVVDTLMSKRDFETAAKSMGLPTPQTIFVESRRDLENKLDLVTYPAILKPQVKNDAFRASMRPKAYRVEDASALRAVYADVAQWEPEVVVQEWISGPDANVAFCLGYASECESVFFAGRKLLQYPVGRGNTALCEPAPEEWETELISLTDRLWDFTSYRGLGSLECKFDAVRRRFFIMEPTVGRTNFQNELAVINGVNLPAIAYFSVLGQRERVADLTQGRRTRPVKLSNWPAERRSATETILSGGMTVLEWFQMRRGPLQTMLWRLRDPMPFATLIALTCVSKLRSTVRQALRLVGRLGALRTPQG